MMQLQLKMSQTKNFILRELNRKKIFFEITSANANSNTFNNIRLNRSNFDENLLELNKTTSVKNNLHEITMAKKHK